MPGLAVSTYTNVKMPEDIWQVAHWRLRGRGAKMANEVVFQQVEHKSKLGSADVRAHRFYESWRVRDGEFLPANGEDWFLCPLSWHAEPGWTCIKARAWFHPGDFLAIMKELDMCDPESPISGVLWSNPGQCPKKYRPTGSSVCRSWTATWDAAPSPDKMRMHIESKTKIGRGCELSKSCNIRKVNRQPKQ